MKKIVTCEESWIHYYHPETKRQSEQLVNIATQAKIS
jgi:hypothetical protein